MKQVSTFFKFICSVIGILAVLAVPLLVQAQISPQAEINRQLGAAAGPGGASLGAPTDLRLIIAAIIRVVLTLVGTLLFVLMVYAGFLWMTAAGNDEQITKAKSLITNAVVGLVIVLLAYSITIAATNIARGLPVGYGVGGWGTFNPFIH